MRLSEPYAPRPVRPLAPLEVDGWRMKVYGIAYGRDLPRRELEVPARELVSTMLPRPAAADGRYGVGYIGVHDGRGACFVFVDWWAAENELHHHVLLSPASDPGQLAPKGDSDPSACVWDLAVMSFERQAWVDCVLANPDGPPDVEDYLARQLDAEV